MTAGRTRQGRAIAQHRAPDRPAIQVAPGDRVTLGDRDTEWPEFVWTALASGLGGWMPSTLFDAERGEASALQDYDTRELDADVGDVLTLHEERAGWWWATNAAGDSGWVPARAIEVDAGPT